MDPKEIERRRKRIEWERKKREEEGKKKVSERRTKERRKEGKRIGVIVLMIIVLFIALYNYFDFFVKKSGDQGSFQEMIGFGLIFIMLLLSFFKDRLPWFIRWPIGMPLLGLCLTIAYFLRAIEVALKVLSLKGKPVLLKIVMGVTFVLLILSLISGTWIWISEKIRKMLGIFPKSCFPGVYEKTRKAFEKKKKKKDKDKDD